MPRPRTELPRKVQILVSTQVILIFSFQIIFIYNAVRGDILISAHFNCTAWGSPSLVEAAPENALRIFRSDGSSKYLLVNVNTQAKEVVVQALKDFNMTSEIYANFALFKVTVANGIVKNSRLPDSMTSLPEQIRLSSR